MSQEDIIKRPKYFAGQYLLEDDFELEQNYHIDRQRRHTRLLTVSGIADGLEVTARDGQIYVAKGTAIAPDGTQIVWVAEETPINLSSGTITSGTYTLSIGYSEVNSADDLQEGSAEGYRRWLEQPLFSLKSPLPEGYIPLAKLTVNDQRQFSRPGDSDSVRQYSGLRFPANSDRAVTFGTAIGGASDRVVLTGSLDVQGTLFTGGNPLAYENYEIYLRGSAANLTEAKRKPDIRIANVSLLETVSDSASGLYTVVIKPDGTVQNNKTLIKVYINSAFSSQVQWQAWVDWIRGSAAPGDVVAVVSCDAIPQPTNSTAVNFLRSIGASKVFQLRNWAADATVCQTPYALLFIMGCTGSAIEALQNSDNNDDNAYLKMTYSDLLNYAYRGNLLVGGDVGIGTKALGADSYAAARLTVRSKTNNATGTPESVLALVRDGVSGESWQNIVDFRIGRYYDGRNAVDPLNPLLGNRSLRPRTQLDIVLAHQNLDMSIEKFTNVMTLRSNGNVGIGTTAPKAKLEVNGTVNISGPEAALVVVGRIGDWTMNSQLVTIERAPQQVMNVTIVIKKSSFNLIPIYSPDYMLGSVTLTLEEPSGATEQWVQTLHTKNGTSDLVPLVNNRSEISFFDSTDPWNELNRTNYVLISVFLMNKI